MAGRGKVWRVMARVVWRLFIREAACFSQGVTPEGRLLIGEVRQNDT